MSYNESLPNNDFLLKSLKLNTSKQFLIFYYYQTIALLCQKLMKKTSEHKKIIQAVLQ